MGLWHSFKQNLPQDFFPICVLRKGSEEEKSSSGRIAFLSSKQHPTWCTHSHSWLYPAAGPEHSSSPTEGAIPHLLYQLHQLQTVQITTQTRRLTPSDPAENRGDVAGAGALYMQSKAVKAEVMCDPERKPGKASQTEKVHMEGDLEASSKKTIY